MAEVEPAAMQAGVVNVLLTIDPVASHAAGTYLTWDGVAFDAEQTARCDAATPHELWAWTVTTDRAPGAAAEPRADPGGQLAQPPAALAAATSAGTLPCR